MAGIADPNGTTPIDMQLSFFRQRKAVRATAVRMIALESGTNDLGARSLV